MSRKLMLETQPYSQMEILGENMNNEQQQMLIKATKHARQSFVPIKFPPDSRSKRGKPKELQLCHL